ncbi:Uncharacterised protein [Bordetella ansorpii]|uniref:Uncharacterized protein n=1 Tax=Bordetella ansorpii TaxID=288768 RepID=A0A157QQM6_9BORD|nr:hypothetical protein [Bordetella ansorpii]SAI47319.1 Uncharacterised protein [Bordetella ansorpii]
MPAPHPVRDLAKPSSLEPIQEDRWAAFWRVAAPILIAAFTVWLPRLAYGLWRYLLWPALKFIWWYVRLVFNVTASIFGVPLRL